MTDASTDSTWGARDHARAQAGTRVDTMPTVPASSLEAAPDGVDRADLTWAETVGAGGYTTKVLARGTTLRLTDRVVALRKRDPRKTEAAVRAHFDDLSDPRYEAWLERPFREVAVLDAERLHLAAEAEPAA